MPDISMCHGDGCKQAEFCYRHRAVPNDHWQAWFGKSPMTTPDQCQHYWSTEGYTRLRPYVPTLPLENGPC